MKKLLIGLLTLGSISVFADSYMQVIDSFENGYRARCSEIIRHNPSANSSRTVYILKCTKIDPSAKFGQLLLRVTTFKNGNLATASFQECLNITYIDSIWRRKAYCH